MAAHNEHPSMHEASVCIGAALAYTLDNWENFSKEFTDAGSKFPKGMEGVKVLMEHLLQDVGVMVMTQKELETALEMAQRILFGG